MAPLNFGARQRFAIEIGNRWENASDLRKVDIWASDQCLTSEDNVAFVPGLRASIGASLDWLRSRCDLTSPFPATEPEETHRRLLAADDGSRDLFAFLQWGPTVDNVVGHLFRVVDHLVFTFEFRRSPTQTPTDFRRVFVVTLSETEMIGVLDQALAALS